MEDLSCVSRETAYQMGYVKGLRDAQPVVRGFWVEHAWAEEYEGRLISNYECSECHEWFRDKSNYCPYCGAKMNEDS